tara:strand:+ start:184055 stop:187393 length:3339 start_codon:yes stop_codon:yes gene_type:complete
MLMHRFIVFVVFFTSSCALFGQATFTAANSGEWNNPNTWNLMFGFDEDGIPDANDNASSVDFTIQINSNEAVKNFSLISNTASHALQILEGNLDINGNLSLVTASEKNKVSTLELYSGNVTIRGDVKYNNPNSIDKGGISIINDDEYEGLSKTITIYGDLNTNQSNKMHINIVGEKKGAFELILAGGITQQIIATDDDVDYSKIIVENQSTLNFYGKDDAPSINDSILVKNGSILLDLISLDKIKEFEHQIVVHSGSKIIAVDDIHFPDHSLKKDGGFVTNMMEGSFSEFRITEGEDSEVLKEAFNYRNVILSGAGKKKLKHDIGGGESDPIVNSISIEEGTLEINASVKDISAIASQLIIKSGATLEIQGDVKMPDATKIILEEGSSLLYSGGKDQTILGNMTYNKLALSGKGKKIFNDPITIVKELSFDSDVKTLNLENDITLKSDASGTAFISEMPKDIKINYGQGQFICEHYFISSPIDNINASENYRDYSLPLIAGEATLSQFDDDNPEKYSFANGQFTDLVEFPIFGVPDSKYPNVPKSNVSAFNSTTGLFETPSSYNASIVQMNDGKITSNAVRFGWADSEGLTVLAKGQINVGDIEFNAKKSSSGKDYNFFGNPYPCAINFDAIVEDNKHFSTSGKGIAPIFYVIAPDLLGANNTGFYNAATKTGTVSKDIPAYQGFFLQVEGDNNKDYDFKIKEDMKSSIDYSTYKSSNEEEKPNLFSIKVYENEAIKDQIHYYLYPGGTTGVDPVLDVKKLEAKLTELIGAKLDFYDGKKKLNLLANAISGAEDLDLQFVVENPASNEITIELTNVSSLFDNYNCVYIENTRTGEIFKTSGDFISISVGTNIYETFAIKASKADDILQIETLDATCFGAEDGNLRFDMSNLPQNSSITILKNKIELEAFNSTKSVYSKTVGAGEYEVVVSGISELCTYTFRNSINESAKIIANFDISDSLFTNTEIVFTSTSENNTVNEWLSSENETLYGKSIALTYDAPGRYWVKLTAIGNYENCKEDKIRYFDVEQLETSVGINNEFFQAVSIATKNNIIEVNNLPQNSAVDLFTTEGKLIQSSTETNAKAAFTTQKAGVYILRITNGNHSTSQQIGVSN